jgi:hypothetical protein
MLDRVLIAERLAELGTASTFGLRAVLTAPPLDSLAEGPLAFLDLSRRGPVRFGAEARTLLVLDHQVVRERAADDLAVRARPSSFGYPYASFGPEVAERGRSFEIPPDEVRRRRRLALSAEISGALAAGIAHTSEHLASREQFGRALSSFQALRHRLAELAVSAEGTRWMVREAAWTGDPRAAARVAWHAAATAGTAVTELTQMCGARGFARDFGLFLYTMRLEGLRLELGGRDRIAVELAGTRHV